LQLSLEFPKLMALDWPKCRSQSKQETVPVLEETWPPLLGNESGDTWQPVRNQELLPLYRAMDLGG